MNELALQPGEPVVGRRPAWMAPAWVIGRLRPQLRAVTTADAAKKHPMSDGHPAGYDGSPVPSEGAAFRT